MHTLFTSEGQFEFMWSTHWLLIFSMLYFMFIISNDSPQLTLLWHLTLWPVFCAATHTNCIGIRKSTKSLISLLCSINETNKYLIHISQICNFINLMCKYLKSNLRICGMFYPYWLQESCSHCQRLNREECKECHKRGHIARDCPDYWRRFHMSTVSTKVNVEI